MGVEFVDELLNVTEVKFVVCITVSILCDDLFVFLLTVSVFTPCVSVCVCFHI